MLEINDRQRMFVDELFLNGFNRVKAYSTVYPDCKGKSVAPAICQIMKKPHVKEYYNDKYKEFREILSIDKYQILDGLRRQIELFDNMTELSLKDSLTTREEEKLGRISELVKGSDIMKARDMICRIIGAYEPEKVEVSNTVYKVGFDLDVNDAEIIP